MNLFGQIHGNSIMTKPRIGIFGGTFDPPHIGHLILAMEACHQLDLSQVLWVLTPNPPHKIGKKISSLKDRAEMVHCAIQENDLFQFSNVDINREGPHYVLDTMLILRDQYPAEELIFLMGGDSLHDLPTWHEPKRFLRACDKIGVMHRPGEIIDCADLEKELPGISEFVEIIEAPLLEISSNKIRAFAENGKPFRYYLPECVYKIIREKSLY